MAMSRCYWQCIIIDHHDEAYRVNLSQRYMLAVHSECDRVSDSSKSPNKFLVGGFYAPVIVASWGSMRP